MDVFNDIDLGYMFSLRKSKTVNYPIKYGFECDQGWHQFIYKMLNEIKEIDIHRTVRVVQIKQKFGGLRCYVDFKDGYGTSDFIMKEQIYNIIDKYEHESYKICEVCGSQGVIRPDLPWKQTLCDDHYNQKKQK